MSRELWKWCRLHIRPPVGAFGCFCNETKHTCRRKHSTLNINYGRTHTTNKLDCYCGDCQNKTTRFRRISTASHDITEETWSWLALLCMSSSVSEKLFFLGYFVRTCLENSSPQLWCYQANVAHSILKSLTCSCDDALTHDYHFCLR